MGNVIQDKASYLSMLVIGPVRCSQAQKKPPTESRRRLWSALVPNAYFRGPSIATMPRVKVFMSFDKGWPAR
jgi:hypothetical protein